MGRGSRVGRYTPSAYHPMTHHPSPIVEVSMSDESIRPGQVSATPEGGPIAEGVPGHEPGLGQVQSTPEAVPLSGNEEPTPPTWQEHMRGPILGTDGLPLSQEQSQASSSTATEPAAAREEDVEASTSSATAPQDDEEL